MEQIFGILVLLLVVLAALNMAMTILIGNRVASLLNYCVLLRQYTAQIADHVNYTDDDGDDPDDDEPMPVEDANVVPFDRKAA